ncbi:MAG: sialidase, partial [Bacteroidota bacterium]
MNPYKLISVFLAIMIFSLNNLAGQKTNNLIMEEEFIFREAPFASCHASTIESTPDGLVAAWFGGTQEKNKDVEIWLSRKTN